MSDRPIHFYLTFNPYLNNLEPGQTQAHEFHDYLESRLKNDPEDYAWWGKMISKDRESKVDIEKVFEVIKSNSELGHSTHLYISDFTNLWVGKVTGVSSGIGEDFKTLEFYRDKKVEIWFKIDDFALLTYTPEETASKLEELYIDNPYHNLKIHSLSPFTSGIRYPAFVQDRAEEPYFDELDLEESSHLIFKYNPALRNNSSRKVLESLHAYGFPEIIYKKIPHSAKTEIESAELDILEKRFHNVRRNALSYIKALEIVLNDLTIGHVKRCGLGQQFYVQPETMPPKLYLDRCKGGLIPISKWHKNYSVNQLIYFIQRCTETNNLAFHKAFKERPQFVKFFKETLMTQLKENKLLEIRGILAHNDSKSISEKDALAIRNIIMGLGCHGLIHQALQLFYEKEFKWMTKTQGDYKRASFKELKKKAA